jgi:uncharacterized protein YjiS (DUF1127 family)
MALENSVGGQAPSRASPAFGVPLARAIRFFADWRERRRSRTAFTSLNAYWLRDIGMNPRPPDPVEQIPISRKIWF